jgi:hypothetical protein
MPLSLATQEAGAASLQLCGQDMERVVGPISFYFIVRQGLAVLPPLIPELAILQS